MNKCRPRLKSGVRQLEMVNREESDESNSLMGFRLANVCSSNKQPGDDEQRGERQP